MHVQVAREADGLLLLERPAIEDHRRPDLLLADVVALSDVGLQDRIGLNDPIDLRPSELHRVRRRGERVGDRHLLGLRQPERLQDLNRARANLRGLTYHELRAPVRKDVEQDAMATPIEALTVLVLDAVEFIPDQDVELSELRIQRSRYHVICEYSCDMKGRESKDYLISISILDIVFLDKYDVAEVSQDRVTRTVNIYIHHAQTSPVLEQPIFSQTRRLTNFMPPDRVSVDSPTLDVQFAVCLLSLSARMAPSSPCSIP